MTALDVTLTGTWFVDPADPTNGIRTEMAGRPQQDSINASVRTYAAGRRRIISTPARGSTSQLALRRVDWDSLVWLRTKLGALLLLRDGSGWRRWGMFAALDEAPLFSGVPQESNTYNVTLTWTDADYGEGV